LELDHKNSVRQLGKIIPQCFLYKTLFTKLKQFKRKIKMKKTSKILLGAFMIMILFSIFSSSMVVAQGPPDQTLEIPGDTIQTQLQANTRTMLRFRQRTQLTFQTNVSLNLTMNCEALRIGEKDFILEVESEKDLQMNMICTREEVQLGLMEGNTYRIRNRNTYQYKEGFCISIDCNGTFLQARLRIRTTNQNRLGTWAYHDETTGNWVSVPTTIEDGYLTAETDHFSTWTILLPNYTIMIIGISVGAIIAVAAIFLVIYFKKRK